MHLSTHRRSSRLTNAPYSCTHVHKSTLHNILLYNILQLLNAYSVPELLGIHAQHSIGEGVGVGEHIGLSKRLVSLETVKDLEELILDEINEDEIDRLVISDSLRGVRADEIRSVEERL